MLFLLKLMLLVKLVIKLLYYFKHALELCVNSPWNIPQTNCKHLVAQF